MHVNLVQATALNRVRWNFTDTVSTEKGSIKKFIFINLKKNVQQFYKQMWSVYKHQNINYISLNLKFEWMYTKWRIYFCRNPPFILLVSHRRELFDWYASEKILSQKIQGSNCRP